MWSFWVFPGRRLATSTPSRPKAPAPAIARPTRIDSDAPEPLLLSLISVILIVVGTWVEVDAGVVDGAIVVAVVEVVVGIVVVVVVGAKVVVVASSGCSKSH